MSHSPVAQRQHGDVVRLLRAVSERVNRSLNRQREIFEAENRLRAMEMKMSEADGGAMEKLLKAAYLSVKLDLLYKRKLYALLYI